MKITLIDKRPSFFDCYFSKDTAGGFGTATRIGKSIYARILEYLKQIRTSIPSITLAYISAILRQNGHDVKLNDYHDADIVIIPSSIFDYNNELKLAQTIKSETDTAVGFIGPFASVKPDIYITHADFIIIGEPEKAILDIRQNNIPVGLIKSRRIDCLDELPFPDWDAFNIDSYRYPAIPGSPFLAIQSSRGCPLSCSYYCPYALSQGTSIRDRTPENVIREIKYLKSRYNIRGFIFRDPIFTFNKNRVLKISESIKNMDISWGCETHIDFLDEKILEKMSESGLCAIELGIESIHPDLLESVHRKNSSTLHQEKLIRYAEKLGIKISAFYLIGLPDDTKESILETIHYAMELNTFGAQFNLFTPYPGTNFFSSIEDKIYSYDWSNYDAYTPVFHHRYINRSTLLHIKEKAFIDYYFRFSWIQKNILK